MNSTKNFESCFDGVQGLVLVNNNAKVSSWYVLSAFLGMAGVLDFG